MVIADRWIMTAAHVLNHKGITTSVESVRVSGLLYMYLHAHCPHVSEFTCYMFPMLLFCRCTWD